MTPSLTRSITALLTLVAVCTVAVASPISPAGERLATLLDQTDVEHLWPAGVHVDWRSGVPDGRRVDTEGRHTHCSAFVAATAEKLGVYILRPPEHSSTLLANAQYDWLADTGPEQGWQPVTDDLHAQIAANQGRLVIAVYRNHHDDKPGHIAIVRPSDKGDAEIEHDGPQVIQAGSTNHISTTLSQGFAGHPAAWGRHELRYYAHAIDWSKVAGGD